MIEVNDIKIEKTEFKGKEYLSIRRWYEKDGKVRPGKQGINLKREEAEELIKSLTQLAQNSIDLDQEIVNTINDNFWELL
jgi:hypothetical protein